MIKLIITDLDGTLLNDKKQAPDDFERIVLELKQQGITWVLASGRQYYTIADQFSSLVPHVYILAENGSLVMNGDQQIHINPLDNHLTRELILRGRQVNNAWPILCCKGSAYVEDNYEPLLNEANKYYKKLQLVDDLTKVDDLVLKYTLCDFTDSETNSYTHFEDLQHRCKVAVAGKIWLDMTNLTATKGTALLKIMEHCDVKPDEVMAFGDYLNDMEMIRIAESSYAMKNAHPELIEAATYVTVHDNNNDGVVKVLKEHFNLS